MGFLRHALAICAASIIGTGAVGAAGQDLRMGAGQQGSQNYGVNAALAQALSGQTDLSFSVQSFGGPAAYLPLIQTGELDVAAVVMPDLADAMRGTGPFEGMAMDNLRLVASLFPSPVGLMVRADSDIRAISDLAGRKVAWGLPAQPSLVPYVVGALANGGLSTDDVQLVPVASVANGVDELMAGRVAATLFALRGGKVVEADSALGGIRWLPFDDSETAVAAMQDAAPESYLVEVTPKSGVLGVAEPMRTMAYDYAVVVGDHVPAEAVEKMARALRDQAAEISASNRVLGDLDPENLLRPYRGLPYHSAAEAVLGND